MAPEIKSCVLVVGTDFKDTELRETLKKLGASWQKAMKGWVLPENARSAVEKLLSGEELSQDDVEGIEDPTADPEPSVGAEAEVDVSDYLKKGANKARSVLVKGDTKTVKEQLVAMSGSWNRGLGGWIFPISKKEQILRVLRADETNVVTEDGDGSEDEDESSSEEEQEEEEEEERPSKKVKKEFL